MKTLDPAFIRRGRMDQHIELSHCKFEGFKILAKNCLHIESHALFDKIKALLEEIDRTPADAVEYLTPNSLGADVENSLRVRFKLLNNKERSCAEEKGRSEAKGNEKTLVRGSSKEIENKKDSCLCFSPESEIKTNHSRMEELELKALEQGSMDRLCIRCKST